MNKNLVKMMLGLCILLLAILMLERQVFSFTEEEMGSNVSAEQLKDINAQLPALKLNQKAKESYSNMVERPLFLKGRKPVVEDKVENIIQVDIGNIDDLALEGIYSIGEQKFAVFRLQGKESKYEIKSEGESISGWALLEVQTDKVIMENSGEKRTVIIRKPKSKPKRFNKSHRKKFPKRPVKKSPKRLKSNALEPTKIKLES